MMSTPSKVHTIQLVKIQPDERLATTSELKGLSPEIHVRFCEGVHNNHGANTPTGDAL